MPHPSGCVARRWSASGSPAVEVDAGTVTDKFGGMHLFTRHQTNGRGMAALLPASTISAISATASIIAAVMLLSVVPVCGSGDNGNEGGGGGGGAVKIKMGVVKRPDSCSTKSRVGDVLAIRASVCTDSPAHRRFFCSWIVVHVAILRECGVRFARCVCTCLQRALTGPLGN